MIARSPGLTKAAPLVIVLQQVLRLGSQTKNVEVFGVQIGGIGDPAVTAGRPLSRPGQVVVDVSAGVTPGTEVTVGAMSLRVVGQVTGRTMLAGVPIIYMPLSRRPGTGLRLQAVAHRGGDPQLPASVPAGLAVSTNSQIEQSVLNNLAGAVSTLKNSMVIMWLVAAMIVGALLYVSALQRVRDFAVIKALGSSSLALFGSLALAGRRGRLARRGLCDGRMQFHGRTVSINP